jgi:cob(I)alamin adenosyltransferase
MAISLIGLSSIYLVRVQRLFLASRNINDLDALATTACEGGLELVRSFIKIGADPNITKAHSATAAMRAAENTASTP